jgi:type IV pilus assembly protein PilN
MIRINLLPVKAAKRRELGQRQIYLLLGVVVAVLAGLFVFHGTQTAQVDEMRRENTRITAEIDKLKNEVGDFDTLKAQREQLVAQRDVIKNLQAARSGPVYLMLELSRILSPGGQPTMDTAAYEECVRKDPNCAYNPRWDPRRVMILDFRETNKELDMTAAAKDNSDVAEFLKRLQLSRFFKDVNLRRTDTVASSEASQKIKHVRFSMEARIVYDEKAPPKEGAN